MFIITMGAFISIVICYKQWNSQSVLFQIPTQCLVCKWLVSYYVAFAYYFGLQAKKILDIIILDIRYYYIRTWNNVLRWMK